MYRSILSHCRSHHPRIQLTTTTTTTTATTYTTIVPILSRIHSLSYSTNSIHTSSTVPKHPPPPPPPSSRSGLWIALGVTTLGGLGYWYTRRYYQQLSQSIENNNNNNNTNVYDKVNDNGLPANSPFKTKPTVIFVLGGPGAGKGTQCNQLVKDYDFVHLSAGDLLRDERNRPNSQYGELINNYIKEGLIVPMEVTINLLLNAMIHSGKSRFLIDGFPRKLDQADAFENTVAKSDFILFFDCPEQEMERRLLNRGKTSGRVDDNIESIRKRFITFRDTSYPVIEKYRSLGKVHQVSCLDTPDNVYAKVRVIFDNMFAKTTNNNSTTTKSATS